MSPERDEPTEEQEDELYEDVPPRSIFAATWFRVVLVVIVLGVIGAVAVPYVLDWMNPPPPPRSAATTQAPPPAAPYTPGAPIAPDKPAADKPAGDKGAADKRDSTLLPAPAPPAPTATPPAGTEPKGGAKPSPGTTASPAVEPKTTAKATTPPSTPPDAAPEAKGKTPAAVTESPAKPATATKPSTPQRAAAKATTPAAAGAYWVQVGAFKDAEAAKRLAAKLRDENFKVEESVRPVGGKASTTAAKAPATGNGSASDQYDVHITGASVDELNKRLAGKGLTAEASGNSVVLKPSQALRDAVALSKDLAVQGFKVQVRRAGGSAAAPAPAEGGAALHRVRVGAFSDRTAAVAAVRELEATGYKPYIARGDQ